MDRARGGALLAGPLSAAPDLHALYTRHHRLVRWIVRASGVPERSVDDVIQDVFVTIHRRRAQATEGDVRRWIVGVTRSVCHSHRRAAARRRDRLARLGEPEPEPSPERWLEGKQAWRRLDTVLAAIDPAQREAWILVELEGLSAPEAAETLGANVNTIYSRVRLARRRIETALADADATAERLRSSGDPGAERSRGVWAGIAARLSGGATAIPVAAGGTATGAIGWLGGLTIGGAIGAGVIGAIVWARAPSRDPQERRDTDARVVLVDDDERAQAHRPPEPAVTSAPAPSSATSTARPAASARDPAPATAQTVSDRSRARRSAPQPEVPTAAPAPASTLAAESKLLRDAARALDRGALDEAAARLDEHARDHPRGTLRPERDRLRDRLQRSRATEPSP